MAQETSNTNSDRTSNDLVWKIVVSIRWEIGTMYVGIQYVAIKYVLHHV